MILNNADITTIARYSTKKIKDKIRLLTKMNKPINLQMLRKEVNQAIHGRYHDFKDTKNPNLIQHRKRKYSIQNHVSFYEYRSARCLFSHSSINQ